MNRMRCVLHREEVDVHPAEGKHPVRTAQMDRNEIYTGKARLVNRGNGIVLRCATKGELAALLSLLRALFPHGGRMKDLMGRVAA